METDLKLVYRNLLIINISLIIGVLLFSVVSLLQMDFNVPPLKSGWETLSIVNVIFFVAIPIASRVSNAILGKINQEIPMVKRIEILQTAMIIRWASVEGVALLSIVGFLVLQDSKQLVIFALCLLMFIYFFLNKEKVVAMLQLDPDQARKFRAESIF